MFKRLVQSVSLIAMAFINASAQADANFLRDQDRELISSIDEEAAPSELRSIDLLGDCSYLHGMPVTPGHTKFADDGKTMALVAHGAELGGHCGQDQGRFAYKVVEGDFDMVVQVSHVTNNGATKFWNEEPTFAKAGIVAREGLGLDDRFTAMWVASKDAYETCPYAYQFALRKTQGAWLGNEAEDCKHPYWAEEACNYVWGSANRKITDPALFARDFPNVWVWLQRKGQTFTARYSADRINWHYTRTPSFEIDFKEKLYVGLALCSASEGNFDARSEAVFRNIAFSAPEEAKDQKR